MYIYEYEYEFEFEFEYKYEFDINIILTGTAVIYIGFEAKKFEIGNCEIVKLWIKKSCCAKIIITPYAKLFTPK